ncbi:glycosyltransferase [Desulfobacterota bacterium M19]
MVSVIISFYKRLSHLKVCLESLRYSAEYFDEVLIADDGSPDYTVNELKRLITRFDFPIRHIWQKKQGFRLAASRNNAIRASRGEYLIFLDCDFAVMPDTITAHINNAKLGRYMGGLVKYLPEMPTNELITQGISPLKLEDFYARLPEKPINREHRRFIKHAILRRLRLIGPRKPQCSSHFSVHKRDIEYINGYDENFTGWGGEDEDLSHRMNLAGFSGFSVIKQARALHLWHHTELGGKNWQHGSNVDYLFRQNINYRCSKGLVS